MAARASFVTGGILLYCAAMNVFVMICHPVLSGEEMLRGYSFDEQSQQYMDEVMDSDVLIFIHPIGGTDTGAPQRLL